MKQVRDAKFIESLISQNDLRAFVCSNRDDLKLFLNEVCSHLTIHVSGVLREALIIFIQGDTLRRLYLLFTIFFKLIFNNLLLIFYSVIC